MLPALQNALETLVEILNNAISYLQFNAYSEFELPSKAKNTFLSWVMIRQKDK